MPAPGPALEAEPGQLTGASRPDRAQTIALYGRDAGKVRTEVIDLQRGLQVVPMATVEGSDDWESQWVP